MMTIKAVICLLFGAVFLVVPIQVMAIYNLSLDAGGALITRLLGAAFIMLGIWLAMARAVDDSAAQRAVCVSSIVADTIGAVVVALTLLSGVGNWLGWANVVLYALLAIGFGAVWLAQPEGHLAL
jgi:hypothetical protein